MNTRKDEILIIKLNEEYIIFELRYINEKFNFMMN
jgi:hypothetical protein